jgi:hypothetical protein
MPGHARRQGGIFLKGISLFTLNQCSLIPFPDKNFHNFTDIRIEK